MCSSANEYGQYLIACIRTLEDEISILQRQMFLSIDKNTGLRDKLFKVNKEKVDKEQQLVLLVANLQRNIETIYNKENNCQYAKESFLCSNSAALGTSHPPSIVHEVVKVHFEP